MRNLTQRAGVLLLCTAVSSAAFAGSSKLTIMDDPRNISIIPIFEESKESLREIPASGSDFSMDQCKAIVEVPLLIRVLKAGKQGEERKADEFLVNSKISQNMLGKCADIDSKIAFETIRNGIMGDIAKLDSFAQKNEVVDVIVKSNSLEINRANIRTAGRRVKDAAIATGNAVQRGAQAGAQKAGEIKDAGVNKAKQIGSAISNGVSSGANYVADKYRAGRDATVNAAKATGNAVRNGYQASKNFVVDKVQSGIAFGKDAIAATPEAARETGKDIVNGLHNSKVNQKVFLPATQAVVDGGFAVRDGAVALKDATIETAQAGKELAAKGAEKTKEAVNDGREKTGGVIGWFGEKISAIGEWIKPSKSEDKKD